MNFDPLNPRFPLGDFVHEVIRWLQSALSGLIGGVRWLLDLLYGSLEYTLATPIFLIMIAIFAAVAWLASGWKLAVVTAIGFYLIRALDLWLPAMQTMALVLVACVMAILLAIPVGILAAKVRAVSLVVKPVLDFMQSMPALAYLVPVISVFSIGQVPGIIATIIFAMPPGVRLTELAIRQVDHEVVEAGQAFGATAWSILRKIQLPLAMPTIMAGINQVIMLALSMVVLAGMVGAQGLGGEIVGALSRVNVPLGVEAGLAVVIVAVYLDRVTAALGHRSPLARALKAST
ncbi:ABC transporter permease [Sediminivirga luteola]|uniref:Glycine/betaine ABC transporter permease n=1 Tax=Sediminivirga luteola TaxID=1774748 RepID=A0A8J2TZ61_9MICO|nr:ABC transporter permease subunit [Sediminivirga luteola]MCI2265005.1 ABC transporter permease subunit [Sediminivirga luteola]GGA19416.1 glycine/betaine ABC transporter permease [Sediminivirga luteola]